MQGNDTALRMTAATLATDLAATGKITEMSPQEALNYIDSVYQWLKKGGDSGGVIQLDVVN